MRMLRFEADTMREALAKVKADLGEEAVILRTKQTTRPGLLGLSPKERVQVWAALQEDSAEPARGGPAELGEIRAELRALRKEIALLAGGDRNETWPSAQQAERQRKAFDPQETAELEQATAALVQQLKAAADEAVERVAQASQHINQLLATTERRMETLWVQEWGKGEPAAKPEAAPAEEGKPAAKGAQVLDTDYMARTAEVYRLADEQLDEAAIAERTGLERAEVRVLLSLRGLSEQAG